MSTTASGLGELHLNFQSTQYCHNIVSSTVFVLLPMYFVCFGSLCTSVCDHDICGYQVIPGKSLLGVYFMFYLGKWRRQPLDERITSSNRATSRAMMICCEMKASNPSLLKPCRHSQPNGDGHRSHRASLVLG
jgi:hypothetical protein